jgi:hypothetical protein
MLKEDKLSDIFESIQSGPPTRTFIILRPRVFKYEKRVEVCSDSRLINSRLAGIE